MISTSVPMIKESFLAAWQRMREWQPNYGTRLVGTDFEVLLHDPSFWTDSEENKKARLKREVAKFERVHNVEIFDYIWNAVKRDEKKGKKK